MSEVRARGTRVAGLSTDSYVTYGYRSPGVTFDCEKLLNNPKELAKMSGEVKTYIRGEQNND